ncbi:MAG TPA: GNAT family N-acetyltransferase, partial [Candidatus Sulfotelmatobacter sp.]|nr:GNAT family N-acetyltransferase [Candidatus Sulfotelmatobacter sp.]
MIAYWWTHGPSEEKSIRLVDEHAGVIRMFVGAWHWAWRDAERRFGSLCVSVHPEAWSERLYRAGVDRAESWLREEDVETSVARIREDRPQEWQILAADGYAEVRRHRHWELDLVANRADLLARAAQARARMRAQGIELLTLDMDSDPHALRKAYELDLESTRDIPTTVPFPVPSYDEWVRMYFENPGVTKERFWIARIGDEVVGMSLIEFPPGRGVPYTEYTGTSPRFRGRGIARALKYQTVAQAIELGATRIRTDNDGANEPILHLNDEMGYRARTPVIEMHRDLTG